MHISVPPPTTHTHTQKRTLASPQTPTHNCKVTHVTYTCTEILLNTIGSEPQNSFKAHLSALADNISHYPAINSTTVIAIDVTISVS
jgi:hypothetical protein